MARKRKTRAQRFSERTEFRLTRSDKRILRKLARQNKMTIASFLRSILRKRLG